MYSDDRGLSLSVAIEEPTAKRHEIHVATATATIQQYTCPFL